MTVKLAALALRHIDPVKLLLERDYPHVDSSPSWYEEMSEGSATVRGWTNGTVLATLETRFHRPDLMYVGVAVTGLYANEQQVEQGNQGDLDSSTLDEATDEEKSAFIEAALIDLYPALRAELQILSGRFSGIPGISLQPTPSLNS
ncbi:hypothetical protein [Rhodococcoides kyotonense]|uniref:Uncharacterized protein n=1 Tax=Rhodococcoides kyotonense TaxID=398843 RepID=A0A239N678_9NOCA|nr:hypothetical protein [Rhodococcus kyotonensis]SNT50230.1 hypothetical protein SAMN05421642_13016 [Rhodococcus kyotonensis]